MHQTDSAARNCHWQVSWSQEENYIGWYSWQYISNNSCSLCCLRNRIKVKTSRNLFLNKKDKFSKSHRAKKKKSYEGVVLKISNPPGCKNSAYIWVTLSLRTHVLVVFSMQYSGHLRQGNHLCIWGASALPHRQLW